MDELVNFTSVKLVSNLQKYDAIEYSSEQINLDKFIVYSIEKDLSIPALLLQIWKFNGGYDHAVYNVVENGFTVNKPVKILSPKKLIAKIEKIINFRKEEYVPERQKFLTDIYPDILSPEKTEEFNIPYTCIVSIGSTELTLNIPEWTPFQKLPVTKLKIGSIVEVWDLDNNFGIMKALKL